MNNMTRRAVEQRALDLWRDAGAPSGLGLTFWLLAELEVGVIEKVEPDDPFLILARLATHAYGPVPSGRPPGYALN
jgi:hypothetical protein